MKLPNGYGSVIRMSRRRRNQFAARVTVGWTDDVDLKKLTFAEIYERWCRQKFKTESVKPVYVAAYKNLAALHEMTFSRIRKRHIQAAIDMEIVATNLPRFGNTRTIRAHGSR